MGAEFCTKKNDEHLHFEIYINKRLHIFRFKSIQHSEVNEKNHKHPKSILQKLRIITPYGCRDLGGFRGTALE